MIQQCVKYIVITVYFNTIILYYLHHLYNPYNVGDGFVCQCVCGYWFQYERIFIASYSSSSQNWNNITESTVDHNGRNEPSFNMADIICHYWWFILFNHYPPNLVNFFTSDFYREKVTL